MRKTKVTLEKELKSFISKCKISKLVHLNRINGGKFRRFRVETPLKYPNGESVHICVDKVHPKDSFTLCEQGSFGSATMRSGFPYSEVTQQNLFQHNIELQPTPGPGRAYHYAYAVKEWESPLKYMAEALHTEAHRKVIPDELEDLKATHTKAWESAARTFIRQLEELLSKSTK